MNDGSTQAYVAPTVPVLDRVQAATGSAAQRAQTVQVLGGSYVSGMPDGRIPGRYTEAEAPRR